MRRFVIGVLAPFAVAAMTLSSPVAAQDLTIASSMPGLECPFFVHMQKELRTAR